MSLARHPHRLDNQLSPVRSALGRDDLLLIDRPHLRAVLRLDRIGVVPEIKAIDIPIVEPHPRMVRMVNALSRPRLQRIATRHRNPLRRDQRIQNRLLQRRRPEIGSKRLPVDRNVDALMRLIGNNLNSLSSAWRSKHSPNQTHHKHCNQKAQHQQSTHRPCLPPSPAGSCRRTSPSARSGSRRHSCKAQSSGYSPLRCWRSASCATARTPSSCACSPKSADRPSYQPPSKPSPHDRSAKSSAADSAASSSPPPLFADSPPSGVTVCLSISIMPPLE